MDLYIGNLIVDAVKYMAKKLESPRITIGHSTTDLSRFASTISDNRLKQCQIDTKYKPLLNHMEKVSPTITFHDFFSFVEKKKADTNESYTAYTISKDTSTRDQPSNGKIVTQT